MPWAYYYGDLPFLGLYPRLLVRSQRIERYYEAAAAGRLPPFCMVEPTFEGPAAVDDHPPRSSQLAQRFVAQVFGAMAASPQWERSLFILTYDEHGGFYDHVPPPAVVDDRATDGFGTLGFRVPALLAGPYVRRGHVESTVLEHASVARFLEWRFGLEPLGVRDANAGNILGSLDFANGDISVPRLPVPTVDPDEARRCGVEGAITGSARGARVAAPPLDWGARLSAGLGSTGRAGRPQDFGDPFGLASCGETTVSPESGAGLGGSAPQTPPDGMELLAAIVPSDFRGDGWCMPDRLTHPNLVEVEGV